MQDSPGYENQQRNPYQVGAQAGVLPSGPMIDRGYVMHVPVFGILLSVQGVLQCLMGAYMGFMGVMMPQLMQQQPNNPFGPQQQLPPNFPMDPESFFLLIFAVMGAINFLPGLLAIIAGIKAYGYQSRTMAIVAVSFNLLTCLGCYCGLTALPLFIYGLIVLLNGPVTEAFRMRAGGLSKEAIQRHFTGVVPLQQTQTPPPGSPPPEQPFDPYNNGAG